jgi:hypothetical protein
MHPARDLRVAQVRADRLEDLRFALRHGGRVSSLVAHCIPSAAMANMLNNPQFSRQARYGG